MLAGRFTGQVNLGAGAVGGPRSNLLARLDATSGSVKGVFDLSFNIERLAPLVTGDVAAAGSGAIFRMTPP